MDSTDAAVKAARPPKPYHPTDLCPCHGCRIAYQRGRQDIIDEMERNLDERFDG